MASFRSCPVRRRRRNSCRIALYSQDRLYGADEVGTLLSEQAGKRLIPITTELGGKAPLIVMDDCPVDLAVNGASFAAFVASGQTCVSATRILVHEKIFAEFLARFAERANNIAKRMGNPQNAETLLARSSALRMQTESTRSFIMPLLVRGSASQVDRDQHPHLLTVTIWQRLALSTRLPS